MTRLAAFVLFVAAACSRGATQHEAVTTTAPRQARAGQAQAPMPSSFDDVIALDKRVRTGVLPNGLTYYVMKHGVPAQRAYLWLAIKAGSVQEDDDQRGLAHLLEHMAFNGTEKYAEQEIVGYLERIGMQFGADLNAETDFDWTIYKLVVPTDADDFIDHGLDILHEWSAKVTMDPVEIDKERGVVLEEWREGRDASARIFDKQAPVLFRSTRYADRLPIGLPEIITKAPRDALVRYYKDWYRPGLMAVIAVGDFDPESVAGRIEALFADLADPPSPRARPGGAVPPADGTRISIVVDPEETDQTISIYNLLPHRRESTYGDFRRIVAENLYHTMLNGRFAELLDKPDAPAVFAGSSTSDVTLDIDGFSRAAQVKRGRLGDAIAMLVSEVRRVELHGFTPTELERAKKEVLRGIVQSARERDKRDAEEFADEITRLFFQNELMPGREREAEMTAALLPGFTLDELNRLAQQWGGDDNRVVLYSGPSKIAPPTEAQIRGWIATATAADIGPWVDALAGKSLMPTPPPPGRIVAEREVPVVDAVEWTLSNGVKVVVKSTDFAIDRVSIDGFSPGGTSLIDDARYASALYASQVVAAGGVADLKYSDVQKLLAGVVVDVDTWIDELSENVHGDGAAADLETMLQLVHLKITAPRRDPQAFATWKSRSIESIRNWTVMPERGFFDEMTRFITRDHPRRRPPSIPQIERVDQDQVMAIYKDRFGDAGDFTFVIVGDIDPAAVRPLVEKYLASLPSGGRKETWRDVGVRLVPGVPQRTVRRGREPKAYVRLIFHGDDTWTRDAAIDAGILADVLEMRLLEILREDMGGVYGVDVGGGISRRPRSVRSFEISFTTAPESVAALKAAVLAEIARIAADGIDADYLDKLRQQRIRGHEVELRDNTYWAVELADAWDYGDDPALIVDISASLARLTSDNVKAAAARFLSTSQYVTGVMLPAN
jgi:zinc protease